MNDPAVILYPSHGCQPVTGRTQAQLDAAMKLRRSAVKDAWEHPGVKALVEIIEQRGCRLQRTAIAPGATVHEAGQAYAIDELITVLHGILLSEESPGG